MESMNDLAEIHWLMDMIRTVDVGLVVLDCDYRIQLWNGFMENHSGLSPMKVRDQDFFELFPAIPQDWLKRKIDSVMLLKSRAFCTWEQHPYLIRFKSYRPVTGHSQFMYQNFTIVPMVSARGQVTHVCLIIYDATESAVAKQELEQANRDLERLSQIDGLTGLFNRRTWQGHLEREHVRCRRSGHASTLVMFDIDHFKRINDNYGHQAGDAALQLLSGALRNHVRGNDIAGRYGGEEFGVLLPDTDEAGAIQFAERLRIIVEGLIVDWGEEQIRFTISLGLHCHTPETLSDKDWLEGADQALYASKEGGRNRTTLYRNGGIVTP
jgi:diguanylate cyclase